MTDTKNVITKSYTGPNRRSEKVWDRRIPNMPMKFGHFLRFLYKSKRRFHFLFGLACIGWIYVISQISIWMYMKYFHLCIR